MNRVINEFDIDIQLGGQIDSEKLKSGRQILKEAKSGSSSCG